MSGLPSDDQTPYVLETSDHESEQSVEDQSAVEVEGIDTGRISRDAALRSFVTAPELAQGRNLEARIARISAEIEELREESGDPRVYDLLSSLRKLQTEKLGQPFVPPSSLQETDTFQQSLYKFNEDNTTFVKSLSAFADLEKRVAAVESRVGFSERPEPIAVVLRDLRRKLNIISASPEEIELQKSRLQQIANRSVNSDKYTKLYDRLQALNPIIDQLPHIISRLQTLNTVHSEAARVSQVVGSLDTTLAAMATDITQWKETLQSLEVELQEAIKVSNSNIEAMDRYKLD